MKKFAIAMALGAMLGFSSLSNAMTVEQASDVAGNMLQASVTAGGGNNVNAGFVITITNSGSSIAATVLATGVGPYDNADDTVIDVINNSTVSVPYITVSSTADILGFDGDGISTYVKGPIGTFGYEGPGVTYSNITGETIASGYLDTFGNPVSDGVAMTATTVSMAVNFTGGLAPGGTSYFSLEEDLAAVGAPPITIGTSVPLPPSAYAGIALLGAFGLMKKYGALKLA